MIKLEIEVTEELGAELKESAKRHFLTPEDVAKFRLSEYAAHNAAKAKSKLDLAEMLMSLAPALTQIGQMLKNKQKED